MIHIVKLGGSLLDLPDAFDRFQAWRAMEMGTRGVLVVGGGNTADLVRDADRRFNLGESRAHWLAIRAMQFNAHLIAGILPKTKMVASHEQAQDAWREGFLAVVEPWEWLGNEELRDKTLAIPHRWSFTSDSIAAHIATHWPKGKQDRVQLTLLKSTLPSKIEPHVDANESPIARAVRLEVVDPDFKETSATLAHVQLIDLRNSSSNASFASFQRDVLR
jgi:hypothetical protein